MEDNPIDEFINAVLEEEKKEFCPGLESFQMHANRIKQEISDSMNAFETQFSNGYSILVEELHRQGVEPPTVSEEVLTRLEDPVQLQEALAQGIVFQLLEFSPETVKKFCEIGVDLIRNSNFEKSKDAFHFLVTIASEVPAFWLGLGFSYTQLQQYKEAAEAFRQVIDLSPHTGQAYLGCINALIKQNDSEEALKICEQGLSYACNHEFEEGTQELRILLENTKNGLKNHQT